MDHADSLRLQLKEPIRVLLEQGHYVAAVKLIYCGIDATAFLGLPANRNTVKDEDFIHWVERYIRLPCREQLAGIDAYAARCAILHSHGTDSQKSRAGLARQMGYYDQSRPELRSDETLVMVSVPALADAFFAGLDQALIDIFSSRERADAANERLPKMFEVIPFGSGDR